LNRYFSASHFSLLCSVSLRFTVYTDSVRAQGANGTIFKILDLRQESNVAEHQEPGP